MSIYGVIAAIIFVSVLSLYFHKARTAVEERFKQRPEASFHEVHKKYFAQHFIPEEKARELWNEVADILELESGKLLPSDRFDVELSPPKHLSFHDASHELKILIERRSMACGVAKESIETLGDYVIQFARVD